MTPPDERRPVGFADGIFADNDGLASGSNASLRSLDWPGLQTLLSVDSTTSRRLDTPIRL
jgi:hypothetical protein